MTKNILFKILYVTKGFLRVKLIQLHLMNARNHLEFNKTFVKISPLFNLNK